jgi:hypothetical protein
MARTTDELLAGLPDTFRYSEALRRISERQLRRLLEDGAVVAFSRGLYRKSDWLSDEDPVEIAARAPRATLCLRSALARQELIDDIPAEIDIAIPRGSWTRPRLPRFGGVTSTPTPLRFGRGRLDIDGGRSIGLYSAERSIIDAFRMRHFERVDLANEALKRWLRQGGAPSELLSLARSFSRTQTALSETLEFLL